jgi:hypothetical protein
MILEKHSRLYKIIVQILWAEKHPIKNLVNIYAMYSAGGCKYTAVFSNPAFPPPKKIKKIFWINFDFTPWVPNEIYITVNTGDILEYLIKTKKL